MSTAYLALGSNVGERLKNLRDAARALDAATGIEVKALSKIYETQSVEGGGPDDFLNAAVRIETQLTARKLLEALQKIETEIGRPQPPRQGPRLIDIDILSYNDEEIDEVGLRIPHPRMHRRAFVLRPLLDVLEGGWAIETELNWE